MGKVGHWNVEKADLDYIICLSCFIAAKIEQSKKPKIDNLIYDYRQLTQKHLRRDKLLEIESQMVITLGFDFNFCNPEHLIDRYLRVTGYQHNKDVYQSAV